MVTAPRLETERLILRGFEPSDYENVHEIFSDEDWSQFIGGPLNRGNSWRAFASLVGHWSIRGYGTFAVDEKSTGQFVGMIGHWFPEEWPEPEIGWTLSKSAAGKGYATEAVNAVLDHTFNTLKWETAISLIAPANEASKKVANRVGAVFEKEITCRDNLVGVYRHPNPNN